MQSIFSCASWPFALSSLEKVLSPLPIYNLVVFCSWVVVLYMSCVLNPYQIFNLQHFFSWSVTFSCYLLNVSFDAQALILMKPNSYYFIVHAVASCLRSHGQSWGHEDLLFSSENFMVFRSYVIDPFWVNFCMYSERRSNLVLLHVNPVIPCHLLKTFFFIESTGHSC